MNNDDEVKQFEAWWDQDCDTRENPYSQHSMMYWAWEAWKAGAAAEREECLEACRMYLNLNDSPEDFQNGVECCIAVITHKSDPDVMARIKARGQG